MGPGQMLGLHAVRRRSGDARGGGVKGFVIRNLSAKKKKAQTPGKKKPAIGQLGAARVDGVGLDE